MIYRLVLTSKFKKGLKLAKRRGLDIALLDDVVEKLLHGIALEEKNVDHELKGKFKGFRECHIQPNWLLIYLLEDEILTLTLVDTGTHSDLFNLSELIIFRNYLLCPSTLLSTKAFVILAKFLF